MNLKDVVFLPGLRGDAADRQQHDADPFAMLIDPLDLTQPVPNGPMKNPAIR